MTERTSHEIETLTIRIPIRLQRRGGRKLIITPEGAAMPTPKPRRDETLVKALVRAHRWRRKIESGRAKSITDLAEQEGVTVAYVCRLLPLTCLAPDIGGNSRWRQPRGAASCQLLKPQVSLWAFQASGPFPSTSESLNPLGCRPSRIASTMSAPSRSAGADDRHRRR
jgi:hypothetical protein